LPIYFGPIALSKSAIGNWQLAIKGASLWIYL
jgi:hypothetical protein